MVDWFSFGAAVAAVIIAVGALIVSLAAWRETRRQADAAERQVHDARAPQFGARLVVYSSGTMSLRLRLMSQWPVKRVRVEFIDDGDWRMESPFENPTSKLFIFHAGDEIKWLVSNDRRPTSPVRLRVTAHPHEPERASEVQLAPWRRTVEAAVEESS